MSAQEAEPLEFTPLAEAHLDEVMPIEVEAYPESWSIGMFRDEIRSTRSHFYAVFSGNALVGYGGFWLVLDEAHLTSVTVRDVYRGRRFGRRIASFLLEHARGLGASRAFLEVRPSNLRARALYSSMGFREVGVRKHYYAKSKEDAIVMMFEWDAQRIST